MKKKIVLLSTILLFIIILNTKVYAATEIDLELYRFRNSSAIDAFADTEEYKNEALPLLKNTFGLEGNTIKVGKETMKFNTQISARQKGNKYELTIGTGDKAITKEVKEEELSSYGYDGTNLEWTVVLLGGAESVERGGNNTRYQIVVKATKLYTESENEEQEPQTEEGNEIENRDVTTPGEVIDNIQDKFEFVSNFAKNPAGTIFTALFDGVLRVVDVIQMIANFFETLPLKTSSDLAVVYSFDYLQADGNESSSSNTDEGAGHRNMYTEVQAGYTENNKSSWQTEDPVNIDIDNTNNAQTTNVEVKEYGFSNKTLIPVIPVDVYTIAKGRIGIFDANFLKVDTNIHPNENSFWFTLRKIATLTIRGLIYITAGILGTSLMFNAFNILKGKLIDKKTPGEERDYMYGLITFAKSLLLLIGTVVIIALAIYINKLFISYSNIDTGTVELPIRVNVKEANYSFSTTQTGVVRYFAQIKNPDLIGEKIMYVFIYLILAVINLVMAILFLLRMVIMMVGSAYGIIIVAARTLGRENLLPMDYQHWVISFFSVSLMQTILIFANSIANSI